MSGMLPLREVSFPVSQKFRVASLKGSRTRGLILFDYNERRPHIQITYGKQHSFICTGLIPGAIRGRSGDIVHIPTQLTFYWFCWNREPIRKNMTFTKFWNSRIVTVFTSFKVPFKVIYNLEAACPDHSMGKWKPEYNLNSYSYLTGILI